MSCSERLSAILDIVSRSGPIDKLISRLKEEIELGYYDGYSGNEVMKKVIKWAEKYKYGDI